jgi:CDP-diacylglycerol--serine O-phosphatidyltransferase
MSSKAWSEKSWAERLVDPRSPDRRPRRAAYALPTLFTAGNVYLGFYALLETFQGSMDMVTTGIASAAVHFQTAAIAIGVAVFLDGLDGRIARLTNTVSEFGREMDSLADSVTFGIAPAVLSFAWGVQFVDPQVDHTLLENLRRAGYFLSFLFLLCGAVRLARFNITKNPVPKNPGRPDRKYFVGMPIPSAAAGLAAVVYATGGEPIHNWIVSGLWLALVALLAFLMVSTWRYPSFKDLSFTQPRSPLSIILICALIYLIVTFSKPVLLVLAVAYVGSGIAIRVGGLVRRWFRRTPRPPQHPRREPEQQIG